MYILIYSRLQKNTPYVSLLGIFWKMNSIKVVAGNLRKRFKKDGASPGKRYKKSPRMTVRAAGWTFPSKIMSERIGR